MSTRPKNREAFSRRRERDRKLSSEQLGAIVKTLPTSLSAVEVTKLGTELESAARNYDCLQSYKHPAPHVMKSRLREIERDSQKLIDSLSVPPHEEVSPASEVFDFGPLGKMLLPTRRKEPALHYSIAEALYKVCAKDLGHPDWVEQVAQNILGHTPATYQYLQNILDDVVQLKRLSQKAAFMPTTPSSSKWRLPKNWRERMFVTDIIKIWLTHTSRQPDSVRSFNREIKGDFVSFARATSKAFAIYLLDTAIDATVKHYLSEGPK